MSNAARSLVVALAAVAAIEVFAGVGEWLLLPSSACRSSLGSSAAVLVGFGLVMFGFASVGTLWRRFIGRRIERVGQRRLKSLHATDPLRAVRVEGLAGRFSGMTRLTNSIWSHPWLTAFFAAGFFVVLFGAFILAGTALEPNSCGH